MGVDPLNPGGWGACAVKLQPFKGHEIVFPFDRLTHY